MSLANKYIHNLLGLLVGVFNGDFLESGLFIFFAERHALELLKPKCAVTFCKNQAGIIHIYGR